MKKINLIGQQFGRWTVIADAPSQNQKTYWHCRCECGTERDVAAISLKNGSSKSCGCWNIDKSKSKGHDLTGQRFGRLVVLEKDLTKTNRPHWKCQCDCGNIIRVQGSNLTTGNTKSCGCYKNELTSARLMRDLRGKKQQYGLLTAIEPTSNRTNTGSVIWKCLCRCGNECFVSEGAFTSANTISCGCLSRSKGEEKIYQLLTEARLDFVEQQSFSSCRFTLTNALAKFDFYVNNEYLIEYDGEQHFNENTKGFLRTL